MDNDDFLLSGGIDHDTRERLRETLNEGKNAGCLFFNIQPTKLKQERIDMQIE
jgi:hypothetical protein